MPIWKEYTDPIELLYVSPLNAWCQACIWLHSLCFVNLRQCIWCEVLRKVLNPVCSAKDRLDFNFYFTAFGGKPYGQVTTTVWEQNLTLYAAWTKSYKTFTHFSNLKLVEGYKVDWDQDPPFGIHALCSSNGSVLYMHKRDVLINKVGTAQSFGNVLKMPQSPETTDTNFCITSYVSWRKIALVN